MGVERLFFSERPDGIRRRPGPRRRPAGGRPARHAGPRGDPERGQDRHRRLRRGRQGAGRADGRDDPRDASCRRPTMPPTPWRSRSASPTGPRRGPARPACSTGRPSRRSHVVRPPTSARSARRWHESAARAAPPATTGRGDRLGRGRRWRRRRRFARHRGRRDRLPRVRAPAVLPSAQPGGRLKLHTYHLVREDQQALYGFRTSDELGLLRAAADRDRGRPEGRPRDRRQRARRGPPAGDHRPGPGRARDASPGSARSSPSGSSSSSRRRSRRPGLPRLGRRSPGGAAGEGEVVAALQALGYSLAEARDASRAALAEPGVDRASRSGSRRRSGASPGLIEAR